MLAAAIKRRPFDLVIAGLESADGFTGTLPIAVAELLGVPCMTFARKLRLKDGTLSIERQTESGYCVVECSLPALVTVTAGVAAVRVPSLSQIGHVKQRPVERLSLVDLGLRPDEVRPTQEVTAIEFAQEKPPGELVEDEAEAAARIVQALKDVRVV